MKKTYFAIYEDKVIASGSKVDVIHQAFNWRINEKRQLIIHPKHYAERTLYSY